ncbi:hypothetical protein [Sulfurimonas sp.]|jgi:hypothetical protein|uniref:hypothetical protein n=1 Tax=Sulfurimonas sp. TaxID=2022749 RepID=UPI0025E5F4F7|nr:hypothetical protein [Sulfurimonas sp.]MCK9472852.1 hypothetical protein [Sulfurimonas sp.]MDD3506707.1 hypothetical protein [Sulfurimonas sp.]
MNKQKYILTVLLLFVTFGHADDISAQIEAMKEAAPKERVEMMNRLKAQIAAMNEEQRAQALGMLQGSMQQEKNRDKNYFEHRMNQNRPTGARQMQQRGMQPSQPKYQGGRQ